MSERPPLRDGRYVVVGQLGEGTQGTTWDGVDKREGRPVAIKQFDVRGARTWKDVELAEREARVLASLSHARLPRYVEHFEEGGVLYLVMEKIEGVPLSVLRKRGPMPEADVLRLLRDAAEVLDYLHGRAPPVIHRDLKPSNVIQRPDGSFAFVDFGAVRDRMRVEGGSTVVGTFGYMAPEQFQGRAGPGSDVYAIGATALALLTGEEPENLPHKGLGIDVDGALKGRANRRLAQVLARMLEPNPDTRPTRIAPMLEGLEGRGDRRSARPEERRDRSSEAPRRGRERNERSDRGPRGDRDIGHHVRQVREAIEDEIDAQIGRESRRARRARQRAERIADRFARRQAYRASRPWRPPWPLVVVLTLGMSLAQMAVAIALRVLVPTVLVLLSVVFGRRLRDAARSVADSAVQAHDAIEWARGFVLGRHDGSQPPGSAALPTDAAASDPRARIADDERDGREGDPRVRVIELGAPEVPGSEDIDDEPDDVAESGPGKRRGA